MPARRGTRTLHGLGGGLTLILPDQARAAVVERAMGTGPPKA